MKTNENPRRPGGRLPWHLLLVLFLAALIVPPAAWCQLREAVPVSSVDDGTISAAKSELLSKRLEGEWVGARLLCRKEEDNAVRCGKPVSFSVTFRKDGTGSSTDEHFPNAFAYRWKSKSEMILVSDINGDELTLFQLEISEGLLTFQAYVYLAIKDPSLPKEASYIHYIFDVQRLK